MPGIDDLESQTDQAYQRGTGAYRPASLGDEESRAAKRSGASTDDVSAAESRGGADSGWSHNVTPKKQGASNKVSWWKRKGPLIGIISGTGIGGGALMFLLSPGMAVLQMQESFASDLDDVTAGLEQRSIHVLRGRISSQLTSGLCGSKVSLKCKFSTSSARQVKAMEKAGIKVACDGGTCDKKLRNKIVSMTFTDGTVVTDAAKLTAALKTNPKAMTDLYRAYNVKFYGLNSFAAAKAYKWLGIDKAKKIVGSTKEKIAKSLNSAVNGKGKPTVGGMAVIEKQSVDDDGNPTGEVTYEDENGKTYTKDEIDGRSKLIKDGLNKVRSTKGFGAAVKGVGIVGAMDGACSIYQTSRMVSLLAKAIRHQRLIVFAMAFLTTASSIRAGTATPEEVEYVGSKLTEVDLREELGESDDGDKLKNPGYGQSAMDSPLWKLSQFGDVPNANNMSTSISSYMVGGTGAGILNGVYQGAKDIIKGAGGASPKEYCSVIQHPLTRTLSIVVGVVSSLNPVGIIRLVAGVGAGVAVTSVAMGYLESMITEQAEDIDLDSTAKYGDFAAAVFTGTSGMYGGVAQASGAAPLTGQNIASYMNTRQESEASYVAMMTDEARSTPFDVSNQYSFLGKAARTASTLTAGSGSFLAKTANLVTGSFASIGSPAQAKTYDANRFNACEDDDYAELGIKADVMCNVRYGWTSQELAMDSLDVVDYMIDNGYVKDDTTEQADLTQLAIKDTKFEKWVKNCAYRETPYGDQGGEDDNDDWVNGANCLGTGGDVDVATLSNFKIFAADYTVIQSMDNEPASFGDGESKPTSPSGSGVNSGNINPEGWAYPLDSPITLTTYDGHNGDDMATPIGSNVYAIRDGTVIAAGVSGAGMARPTFCPGFASWIPPQVEVIIDSTVDGAKYTHRYAHLLDGQVTVSVGSTVKAGDLIAKSGNSGCTSGPHLHLDINNGAILPRQIFGGSF